MCIRVLLRVSSTNHLNRPHLICTHSEKSVFSSIYLHCVCNFIQPRPSNQPDSKQIHCINVHCTKHLKLFMLYIFKPDDVKDIQTVLMSFILWMRRDFMGKPFVRLHWLGRRRACKRQVVRVMMVVCLVAVANVSVFGHYNVWRYNLLVHNMGEWIWREHKLACVLS